jgi:hypothetical protein
MNLMGQDNRNKGFVVGFLAFLPAVIILVAIGIEIEGKSAKELSGTVQGLLWGLALYIFGCAIVMILYGFVKRKGEPLRPKTILKVILVFILFITIKLWFQTW